MTTKVVSVAEPQVRPEDLELEVPQAERCIKVVYAVCVLISNKICDEC